jgi:hypothetical protein
LTLHIATLVSFAILLIVLFLWLPRSIAYVKRSYWSHQCLSYAAPANEVCHESHASGDGDVWVDTARVPECWTRFYSNISPYGFRSSGTVFLHKRRSPAGHERLVAIDVVVSEPHAMTRGFYFRARIFDCSSIFSGVTQVADMDLATGKTAETFTPYGDLKVMSVHPDSMDHSHFTIEMDLDGAHRMEEGWLCDNDTIELVLR